MKFLDEREERIFQHWLDRLGAKKVSWEQFLQKVGDPLLVSRFKTAVDGRSLFHLAVLDNRLDVVRVLKQDPFLISLRDVFGLSPIELAQFLNRKEILALVHPPSGPTFCSAFPELSPFEYLPYPIFETSEGLHDILIHVARAKKEDKIPAEKIWMGIYFDKEIRKGVHPPISIRYIGKEMGYGVFANKKIPPCTYAGEYTGIIQQKDTKQLEGKRHCLCYSIWEGKRRFAIDAKEKGNFTRFINRSTKPNLGLQSVYWRGIPRMIFVTLKEIQEGAQLTFDYGSRFLETDDH